MDMEDARSTLLFKKLLQKQSGFEWRNLIYFCHPWTFAFQESKFTFGSFLAPLSIPHTTQITQITHINLKTRSPLLLGLGGSEGLQYFSYPKWVVSWICNLKSFYLQNTQISETKDFRGSYYWAIDPAAGLRALMVSVWCYLPCKRRDSNELGVLSQSSIWRPYPSRFPRTEENNAIAYSSRSTLNIDTTNLSASNGFIFCKVLNYTYFPKRPSKVNSLIEGINFYTCLTHARIKHLPLLTSRCVLV